MFWTCLQHLLGSIYWLSRTVLFLVLVDLEAMRCVLIGTDRVKLCCEYLVCTCPVLLLFSAVYGEAKWTRQCEYCQAK